MTNQRLQVIGFFILLGVASLVVILMWWPFLTLVALGGILAVLFAPVHKMLSKKIKSESWSAFLTIILILLIVFIPLYFVAQVLITELVNLYNLFQAGEISINKTVIIQHLPLEVRDGAESILSDFGQRLSNLTANLGSISGLGYKGGGIFFSLFFVFFTIYYLLRDGDKLRGYAASIFPLSEKHETQILDKLEQAVSGVVKGSFLVALCQGAVATIGFLIFGVPGAFLWGAFTVLAALVPTVGTSLALIPAVIYLFVTGSTGAGIGLAIWGALAVGLIDNVLSPKLIGSRTNLHPLLVLFSVVGGLQFFGVIGFLLGPILMAVFVTLLDIYRTDLKEHLEK